MQGTFVFLKDCNKEDSELESVLRELPVKADVSEVEHSDKALDERDMVYLVDLLGVVVEDRSEYHVFPVRTPAIEYVPTYHNTGSAKWIHANNHVIMLEYRNRLFRLYNVFHIGS